VPLVALLDTNVWISAFLKPTGPPGQVVTRWRRSAIESESLPFDNSFAISHAERSGKRSFRTARNSARTMVQQSHLT